MRARVALETDLRRWRARASAAAHDADARIVASGTSPTTVEPHLFRDKRYRRMAARLGLTADEQLTCGCHVHVSVNSEDEAVGVIDRIRVWLPCLLALSANSPFWQGRDTRYDSFRLQAMYRWPGSGPTCSPSGCGGSTKTGCMSRSLRNNWRHTPKPRRYKRGRLVSR